ncbi:MAG: sigma-70 family RNA polymerase sigma factor [Candidatus Dormibacteraceae bacterium]
MDGLTEVDLARALAAGEVRALEQLYDHYGTLAYSLAVRVLGDVGQAEDVVQEAFLKVWDGAARFDPHRGSLRTWLLTVVRNRAIDHLRGRHAHERAELEVPDQLAAEEARFDPWHQVSLTIQREAVMEALDRLPPAQRQAIELAYFGGYTQREIAEMIQIPIGSVKGRMRLALEKMQPYLLAKGLFDD